LLSGRIDEPPKFTSLKVIFGNLGKKLEDFGWSSEKYPNFRKSYFTNTEEKS